MLAAQADVAAQMIEASIDKETAWTGEAVVLTITLYAPGPFSGTASFDLPELPQTAIVKMGTPTVGNETIDGESLLTQRHLFRVYSQQAGTVVIPAFNVRFYAKRSYLGDAEPFQGATSELSYQSKRLRGTEGRQAVLTAASLNVSQVLQPSGTKPLAAGDIVRRKITQEATGTASMMLVPVSSEPLKGVRVYTSEPIVEDRTERGRTYARRVDSIRYQFETAGRFELPSIEFLRWDPIAEEIRRERLAGQNYEVIASQEIENVNSRESSAWLLIAGTVLFFALVTLVWKAVVRPLEITEKGQWIQSVREVKSACAANDAARAYSALLKWQRLVKQTYCESPSASLEQEDWHLEWHRLSMSLFGKQEVEESWKGQAMLSAFLRQQQEFSDKQRIVEAGLPMLNPTSG